MNTSDLPPTWATSPLSALGEWSGGGTPSKTIDEYWNGDIPWVSPKDMKQDVIFDSTDHITENAINNSAAKLIPPNSILFVTRSGILAHTFPVAIAMVPVTVNQDVKTLTPSRGVDPKYLLWLLRAKEKQILEACTKNGTTVASIETARLRSLEVPIAPQNEQRRIVAKIEEMFSELDKGIESLKTAQRQLRVYRQTLLKHAFEGKLTAQWRATNSNKIQSAVALLNRIQQEREQRYQQQLSEWETRGRLGSKPKLQKALPPLTAEELVGLPKLPIGWTWIRPEEICAQEPHSIGIGPFGSNLKVSDYRDEGIPLIFVNNITRSDFLANRKFVDEAKSVELAAHTVKPLDLLITKMGDPPGDCEIYPEGAPPAILTADCLKFRLWDEFARTKLYKFCINSNLVKRQLGLITKGVAQKKISVERFKTICLPFFCVEEQDALLPKLEAKLAECEQLERSLAAAFEKCEALRQSILKKAFSGQLVPQDPSDEPASVLLDRIRAAKVAPVSTREERYS